MSDTYFVYSRVPGKGNPWKKTGPLGREQAASRVRYEKQFQDTKLVNIKPGQPSDPSTLMAKGILPQ